MEGVVKIRVEDVNTGELIIDKVVDKFSGVVIDGDQIGHFSAGTFNVIDAMEMKSELVEEGDTLLSTVVEKAVEVGITEMHLTPDQIDEIMEMTDRVDKKIRDLRARGEL